MFLEGQRTKEYPFRAVWLKTEQEGVQMAVSVPKKKLKKAVDRNRVKRLVREAYRLNKPEISGYAIMFIYMDYKLPEFDFVQQKIKTLLQRFIEEAKS